MNELDVFNQTELEAYNAMSVKDKITSLTDDATGMGWWYATNKQREVDRHQWLTQEALLFYIAHLKSTTKEAAE